MEQAQGFFAFLHPWLPSGQPLLWLAQITVILSLIFVAHLLLRAVLSRLMTKAVNSKNPWDDVVVRSFRQPLRLLIWWQGLLWLLQVSDQFIPDSMLAIIPLAQKVVLIWLLALFCLRFVSGMERIFRDPKHPMDLTTGSAICKLLRVIIFIIAVLLMLQILQVNISGILAFGGIGGIAVGFAAKDLLANFFGGLIIYMDRPFKVGDWIRSPDKQIEGTVENIGWRLTRIRTFDKRPLYVPNSLFTTISVENPSRMTNRRIYEYFGLRYNDAAQLDAIVTAVKIMLQSHDAIDTTQTLMVNVDRFSPSSIDFFVYTFTKTTEWVLYHQIKQDVMLRILSIIEAHGAQVAYPTQTIKLAAHEAAADEIGTPQ